jgi:hypothetical protein
MSHHNALPCVASFPPAALPAFFGTTKLSDSLCLICLPPSSVVRHTLVTPRETQGLPGCRVIIVSNMPWSLTPRKRTFLAFSGNARVDFHSRYSVVLPVATITWLNPFTLADYGLLACCPTLKPDCYQSASKDSLPGGWPSFRGGTFTRLITRPCPAAHRWLSPIKPVIQCHPRV